MKIEILETGCTFEYGDVKKIVIYGGGKILFQINQDYLEEYGTNNRGIYTAAYGGRVHAMNLKTAPKRAIKENLERKDNYYLKYRGDYSWESGKVLYIHGSEINVIDDGEKLAMETEEEKNYLHAFTLENNAGFVMKRLHCERVFDAGPKWTIPDGGKWGSGYGPEDAPQYDLSHDDKWVLKKWFTFETVTQLKTAQRFYTRCEYSENRKRAKEIAKRCNENNVFYKDVSFYEIEKLLKFYDLEEK